ncbi:MAG: aldo/keto reductase [Rhizobiales bacterium]|nr:aldo/keto reductase [Hyphomicrobiales bacterium]
MAKTVTLPNGTKLPALGLGTWHMGERGGGAEAAALRTGIELGLRVIDTAEMYADGGAEEVVADAMAGLRERVYLVSKVLPHNASHHGTIAACERSLKRLKTDRIDLYLLHWRGSVRLSESVEAFEQLKAAGKIVRWGVSNFDKDDMQELHRLANGKHCIANQVLYHAGSRGIEFDLLPYHQQHGLLTMAYCPLGQAALLSHPLLAKIASKHKAATSAVALAWLMTKQGVLPIPKSAQPDRVRDFVKALDFELDAEDIALIDKEFPPPRRKTPLDIV